MFKNVKKRDGRTAEFDSSAIILAIAKAGKATGTELEQAWCLANLSSCHRDRRQTSQARLCAQEALTSVSPCPMKQQYRSAPFASVSLEGLERHRKSRRNQLLFPKNGLPILPVCNMKGDKGANLGVARNLTRGEAL